MHRIQRIGLQLRQPALTGLAEATAFVAGFLMLMLFPVELWIAAIGFGVMLASALAVYRYLKQLTKEQVRAMQQSGRFSIAAILARMSGRFQGPQQPPE